MERKREGVERESNQNASCICLKLSGTKSDFKSLKMGWRLIEENTQHQSLASIHTCTHIVLHTYTDMSTHKIGYVPSF